MARPAPSADRVVAVLNFFAEHPEHGFTLTDIIRALQLNRATCHALLGALTDHGYLYRDAAKKYRMGPALAAIGRVAYQSFAPVASAKDMMRRLADRHDLSCLAASRVGNELVFLERMVSRSNLEPAAQAQRRYTIHPPGGSSFVAWSPPAEIEAWLAAFDPPLGRAGRANVLAAFARMRALGFSYSIPSEGSERLSDPLVQMASGRPPSAASRASYVPDFAPEIDEAARYSVVYISAPVLGAASELLFTLSLTGFRAPLEGRKILALGDELRASAEQVSAALLPKAVGSHY